MSLNLPALEGILQERRIIDAVLLSLEWIREGRAGALLERSDTGDVLVALRLTHHELEDGHRSILDIQESQPVLIPRAHVDEGERLAAYVGGWRAALGETFCAWVDGATSGSALHQDLLAGSGHLKHPRSLVFPEVLSRPELHSELDFKEVIAGPDCLGRLVESAVEVPGALSIPRLQVVLSDGSKRLVQWVPPGAPDDATLAREAMAYGEKLRAYLLHPQTLVQARDLAFKYPGGASAPHGLRRFVLLEAPEPVRDYLVDHWPQWLLLTAMLECHRRFKERWLSVSPDKGQIKLGSLEGVDFSGANLESAMLSGACLDRARLRGTLLKGAMLATASLQGADLAGAVLEGASLEMARLRGANLQGANLFGARLSNARLGSACLSGADLRGANLIGADLTGADLTGANFGDAQLHDADLRGANLHGALFESTDLTGVQSDGETRWPKGFMWP